MSFAVVGCYIVVLQLMLICSRCSADRSQEGTAQCQNLEVLMVHNSSTGMEIILTSTLSNSTLSERDADLHLPNRYLPPECGANNHRCSILHIERSKTSYYIIPSIGGFIILSHSANYSDQEDLQASFVNITEKCNPTKSFYTRNYIVVACMDLPTGSEGEIFYLRYDFSTVRGTLLTLTNIEVQSEPIFNTETVSEVILLTGQKRCQSASNLYFIDDAYVVHSRSKLSPREFITSTEELQDCVGYLENYGDDIIVIRCTDSKTVLYDTCGAGSFNYQPLEHIPYPCSSWNTVTYHNGSQLALVNGRGGEVYATQELPFDDISFGRCIRGAHQSIFIVSSADGSIFIAHFNDNNFTKIASGNCSNNGGISCPRPVFSENEHIFGIFDSEIDSFVIVNVTEGCMDDPVIAQLSTAFVPDLVSVSLGEGNYNCHCSAAQNTEPLTATQTESTPKTIQTEVSTSPISQTEHNIINAKPTKSTVFSTWLEKGLFLGALSLVVVSMAVAVIILIIVYRKYIHPCFNHTKTKEYSHSNINVQSQQETAGSPHHLYVDLGRSGINRCYGQCGSGETTPNISIAESDRTANSISGESEQTLPCHESGLNGGGHVLPNSDCLPFTSSQLTAKATYDNYQQNCSSNNTAAKVPFFKTRGE